MDSDSDRAKDGDGDMAAYTPSAFTARNNNPRHTTQSNEDEDAAPPTGLNAAFYLVKAIFKAIYDYLKTTLDTFPIISFWLTWIFITMGCLSVITRWFSAPFYYSIFRSYTFGSFLSIFMPISMPFNWLGAAAMAFHGSRIEECRGSSYLLSFILLITILTQGTLAIIRIFTVVRIPINGPDDGTIVVLSWLQRHYTLFDSYGWDFLPFSLVMLHGFITKHPYIALFGVPLRVHMIPGLLCIGMLYSLTHGGHISLTIPIAVGITWTFKYLWLSPRYTKLTGLLFTPLLCQFGSPLQKFIPWEYKPYQPQGQGVSSQNGAYSGMSAQQQLHQQRQQSERENAIAQLSQVELMWEQTEYSASQYVVSLRTSEQFGELQATEATLSRPLSTLSSPLSFLPLLPVLDSNGSYNYSNTSTTISPPLTTDSLSTTPLRSASYSSSAQLPDGNNNSVVTDQLDHLGQNGMRVQADSTDPNFTMLNSPSQAPIISNIPQNQRRYGGSGSNMYPQRTPSNSSEDMGMLGNGGANNATDTLSLTSSISTQSTGRYNEHSSLLVESPDQTCFECDCVEFAGQKKNGSECLRHLKFKSLIFKHTKHEYTPYQVEYVTVRDKEYYD